MSVDLADETQLGRRAPAKGTVQPVPLEWPQPNIRNKGGDIRGSSDAAVSDAMAACDRGLGQQDGDSQALSIASRQRDWQTSAHTLPLTPAALRCLGARPSRGVRDPSDRVPRDAQLLQPWAIGPCLLPKGARHEPSLHPPACGCSSRAPLLLLVPHQLQLRTQRVVVAPGRLRSPQTQNGEQTHPLASHPPAAEGLYKTSLRSHSRRARRCSQGARLLRAIAHYSVQALLVMEQMRSAQCSSSLFNPAAEPSLAPGPAQPPGVPAGVCVCWSSCGAPKGGSKGQGDIKPHEASHLPTRRRPLQPSPAPSTEILQE